MSPSLNYYNQLIDINCDEYKQDNFQQSLKYTNNGLKFHRMLNTWRYAGIKFEIVSGFDFKSDDELISSFRKIQIKIDRRNFRRLHTDNFDENLCKLEYNEDDELLTIII